jgi:hypothetical protein
MSRVDAHGHIHDDKGQFAGHVGTVTDAARQAAGQATVSAGFDDDLTGPVNAPL